MPIEEKRTLKPIPSPSGCGNSEKSRAPAGAQPQAGGYRYGRWVGLDHQSKATQNKSSPGLSVERAYFKIRPGRTTCAYGPDTYRENPLAGVCEPSGECAVRREILSPGGKHTEARPADDTARRAWLRSRAAACGRNRRGGAGAAVQICKRAASRAAYLGNGNPGQRSGFCKRAPSRAAKTG